MSLVFFRQSRRLLLMIMSSLMLVACGRHLTPSSLPKHMQESPRNYWEEMAPRCAGFPSKAHCDDGDMTLFGGLLCASGDERGCDLVRHSQGADGRFWRSPRRTPGNLGERKSFSRDMALGVMLYLVTTRDSVAAEQWINWVRHNRACITRKPDALGGGCLIHGPYRFCTDDEHQSCALTPGNWSLLGRVFTYLDLQQTPEMLLNAGLDTELVWIQAQSAPLGYQTHLPAVEVYLKILMEVTDDQRRKAAQILHERQPDNPFFAFLHRGYDVSLRDSMIALCPQPTRPSGRRHQWAWERDTAEQAWLHSSGWDCLFLSNLFDVNPI